MSCVRFHEANVRLFASYRSPNTATLSGVPTKTMPSATIGVMNLLPAPK